MRPLADLIQTQRLDCLDQGARIYKKVDEMSDSIEIVARQLKRESDRDGE